jgi:hypothetical protein
MKVLYVIKAPGWDDGQLPFKEVEIFRFVKEAETFETCDEDALKFFDQYIRKPENRWDYLKLEKHSGENITTIDHTGWFINTKTTSP